MPDGGTGQALGPAVPLAKAEGAFLALAAGDALGWPQEIRRSVRSNASGTSSPRIEFRTWTRRTGGRYRPYEETIGAGEYSDDTQLTLAVARSRTNHGVDWWKAFMRVELPRWTIYERGGGGATKRAAQAWLAGGPPWQSGKIDAVRRYFDAGGNGVAMRVLPHALFLAGQDDPAVLLHDVVRDGAATHGHPRALVGATACAYAAWSLARRNQTLGFGELLDLLIDEQDGWGAFPDMVRGGDEWFAAAGRVLDEPYERLWERTVGEMRQLLEQARNGIRAGALADDRAVLDDLGCFGRFKGAGTVTAAAAAYLAARHAAQPAQGVLRAAFERGADTDTLAAMTGGLLGCLAGDEWLPAPWRDVQDAAYLRYIAGRVVQGPAGAEQRPVETPAAPQSILTDLVRKRDQEVALGESTRVHATALPDPQPLSKSIRVRAWRLRTPEGQTMYVTVIEANGRPRVGPKSRAARFVKKTLFRRGAYYIEFEEGHAGVLVVADFHRSPRAVLHRVNHPKENDAARWMGVAVSTGSRSMPVTMGRMLFPGDPLLNELKVTRLPDFAELIREVEQADPEVFREPEITQEVLGHTGSDIRHVICVDVLGFKQIVESDPGITTRTRILSRPGLEEATFGKEGIEVESTSVSRSGPANLVFLAHQLSDGRFGQISGPPKDVGFFADHLVVASDSLYGVYSEPLQALEASIHAIRWCLRSVDPFSHHHAIRVGIGSGTSVRLCESNDDEVVNGLREKGHVVAMYYGTGYVNAYLAEQKLCKGRGPCIVAAPNFCQQISGQIEGLVGSGRLVPHPKEPGAFDANYLIGLSDEEVAEYRKRLKYLGEACIDRTPASHKDEFKQRFAESLREFDCYDELRKKG